MDIHDFLTCVAMWLCSVDSYVVITQFSNWLKYKFN